MQERGAFERYVRLDHWRIVMVLNRILSELTPVSHTPSGRNIRLRRLEDDRPPRVSHENGHESNKPLGLPVWSTFTLPKTKISEGGSNIRERISKQCSRRFVRPSKIFVWGHNSVELTMMIAWRCVSQLHAPQTTISERRKRFRWVVLEALFITFSQNIVTCCYYLW
jgi:hypothetical protein